MTMPVVPITSKFYKLERLLKWDKVDKVNEMLLSGISPHKVEEYCRINGFAISHPKLYEYKSYLQEAITRRITVEKLLGIGAPARKPILIEQLANEGTIQYVKNEVEVLDAIIQRGFNALTKDPTIRLQDAMRAIELKNKLTGGTHAGLTTYGLDKLRELEQAKFDAVTRVIMRYLPEDKFEELQQEIQNAERTFYQNNAPELLSEYEKALEQEEINDPIIDPDIKPENFE